MLKILLRYKVILIVLFTLVIPWNYILISLFHTPPLWLLYICALALPWIGLWYLRPSVWFDVPGRKIWFGILVFWQSLLCFSEGFAAFGYDWISNMNPVTQVGTIVYEFILVPIGVIGLYSLACSTIVYILLRIIGFGFLLFAGRTILKKESHDYEL